MELNFRFPFPYGNSTHPDSEVMSYDGCYDLNYRRICELYRTTKRKYSHIKWNAINSNEHQSLFGSHPHGGISACLVTIENPVTGKFLAMNNCDNAGYILYKEFQENCVELFASIGLHQDTVYYQPYDVQATPISAMTDFLYAYHRVEEAYKQNQLYDTRQLPPKPSFRAAGRYLFRRYMETDDRFEIHTQRIHDDLFIDELNRYTINIDVNSVAEISSRTYEILGLGCALVRPTLQSVKFHNPLVPDYHYAALKLDLKDFGDYRLLAEAYLDRLEDLKKDLDYVKFLSENGRRWYEQNCIFENYLEIVTTLMNPNKLLT